ncbi:DUF1513 domain-containing protein [Zobellella aerophila]|uniref:DUF1513 domain-containing protein n=1 Tax=Zobellella aerophila TaxID=870480 RepID=A0ABP6W232_9GAMM
MQRRRFLQGLSAAGVLYSLGLAGCALPRTQGSYLIGGGLSGQGRFVVQSMTLDGQLRYRFALPARGHGMAVHPSRPLAVCHGRRPGTFISLFNHHSGKQLHTRPADQNRHYYGHGVFSGDGRLLYTTEGVDRSSEGIIGVYELEQERLTKVAEYSGFGIGPHEVRLMPGGRELVIGVGGVHTRGREPLNLETMRPSLSYIDATTGELTERVGLPDRHLSIRHLAVSTDGQVYCGQQYRGSPDDYPPLVASHRRGQPLTRLGGGALQWARFNHYIASIAVTDSLVAATSPVGNCYGLWRRDDGELIHIKPLPDASGASALGQQVWLGSGQGSLRHITASPAGIHEGTIYSAHQWDNHWALIDPHSPPRMKTTTHTTSFSSRCTML